MAYRSTEKTRAKKDTKRTAMMQAALRVFAERGYHAATVRDIVSAAGVAIGTFYFYFPDKETLFIFLYEETADFLLQALDQAMRPQQTLARKVASALQAYLNVAMYEPAVVQLLLTGGAGAVPALAPKHDEFRGRIVALWQKQLDIALAHERSDFTETRLAAEFIAGGCDEVILGLIQKPNAEDVADGVIQDVADLILRAVGYAKGG